jgi:hypothetical protein
MTEQVLFCDKTEKKVYPLQNCVQDSQIFAETGALPQNSKDLPKLTALIPPFLVSGRLVNRVFPV